MKKLILMMLFILVACSNREVLVCEKTIYMQQFADVEITVTTQVEFEQEAITKYQSHYYLKLKDYPAEEIADIYDSIKVYYNQPGNRPLGSEVNYYLGEDHVIYEIIYDMNNYDQALKEYFGDIDSVRYNLEIRDNYTCY